MGQCLWKLSKARGPQNGVQWGSGGLLGSGGLTPPLRVCRHKPVIRVPSRWSPHRNPEQGSERAVGAGALASWPC